MSKKFLALFVVLAMLAALTACGGGSTSSSTAPSTAAPSGGSSTAPSAPTGESSTEPAAGGDVVYETGPLVVGSWGGTLDPVVESLIVPQFKELTGQELILDPSYSSVKMIAEGEGNVSVDVAIMGDSEVADLTNYGLIREIDFSRIEMEPDFYAKAHDQTKNGVFFNWGRYGIVYRADLVPFVPTSWSDLWDPAFAGKVGINHPKSTAGQQLLSMAAQLNGGDQYNIDPGFEALGRLAETNLFTVVESTSMMNELLTSGDVWIAGWWDGRTYFLQNSGIDVQFLVPEEGAFATINEWVIPKDTDKVNLAYAFINLCLAPENQMELVASMGYGPCDKVSAAMLPEDLAAKTVSTEEQANNLIILDWLKISKNKSEWMERFDKEIVAKIQR